MIELAERVKRIKPSPTLSVSTRAEEMILSGKDVISLSVGEPDFDTPDFIKNAAIQAIHDGLTKYTAVDGRRTLKQAIIDKLSKENQLRYDLSQIIVSCGAKHSLYNLFAAVLNQGDEVIIPAPYWVSYLDMALMVDATPVVTAPDFNNKFKMTPDQLQAAITPRSRLFIINSPSNPSGVAYTKKELMALGEVLAAHPRILIATDDIYEHTLWNVKPFNNILMACPQLYDRCVVINGVSKTYAMTGWRIGYAAGPAPIIAAMKKMQSQSTSNPTSISQAAAEAALTGDQSCISVMTNAYKERHDFILPALNQMKGVQCIPSDGTFYTFPRVSDILSRSSEIKDDTALAEYLLNEAGVAVIPGTAFGAPGHLRLSYANSMEKIREAMVRMQKAFVKL